MPIIYYEKDDRNVLKCEPYRTLAAKICEIMTGSGEGNVSFRVGGEPMEFVNGFYTDDTTTPDPEVQFMVLRIPCGGYFVRMCFSFDCSGDNLRYNQTKALSLKERIPYFFIPNASALRFSTQIDERLCFRFDTVVDHSDYVCQVCCSLLNQVIAIFAFEN